mmetsp:Transcript_5150/g.16632  ORF Transcript_5150/g.16632 Transcript_5150/m.16632 type:complete len:212 (+) Transcript_5150:122-757(+)
MICSLVTADAAPSSHWTWNFSSAKPKQRHDSHLPLLSAWNRRACARKGKNTPASLIPASIHSSGDRVSNSLLSKSSKPIQCVLAQFECWKEIPRCISNASMSKDSYHFFRLSTVTFRGLAPERWAWTSTTLGATSVAASLWSTGKASDARCLMCLESLNALALADLRICGTSVTESAPGDGPNLHDSTSNGRCAFTTSEKTPRCLKFDFGS